VLSEPAWRTRFGSTPDIVGRLIHLNRRPFTVVGVSPSLQLPGPGNDSELWIPYTMLGQLRPAEDSFDFADPRAQWLNVMGRRKADRSLRQVEEELRAIARSADADVPGRHTTVNVTDGALINDPDMGQRAPAILTVTLGTTTVLLLLACVNVTTLLLSRSAARQREISCSSVARCGKIQAVAPTAHRELGTQRRLRPGDSAHRPMGSRSAVELGGFFPGTLRSET
jgi:hypothetical protein